MGQTSVPIQWHLFLVWIHALHSPPQLSWGTGEQVVLGDMEQVFIFLQTSEPHQHHSMVWASPPGLSFLFPDSVRYWHNSVCRGSLATTSMQSVLVNSSASGGVREKDFCWHCVVHVFFTSRYSSPHREFKLEILVRPFQLLCRLNGKEQYLLEYNSCSSKNLVENRS